MRNKLDSRDVRDALWRKWGGDVPVEAFQLVSELFELIGQREEEICNLRSERDALVEAFLNGYAQTQHV